MGVKHDLYVNGRWLGEVGPWSKVRYSHGRMWGPLRSSWQMDAVRHPNLFCGASVLINLGGVTVWRGLLNEPGRDGAMSAIGLWEQGKGATSMTSTGATTAEPRDAIDRARERGAVTWALPVPDIYPGVAAQQMDAPYPAQSVVSLVERVASEQGVNVAIDSPTGALVAYSSPTTPTWLVPSKVAGYGLTPADDDIATHLYAEYLTGPGQSALTDPPVVSPDYITNTPRIERLVPLIDKGFITNTQARGYLTAMFGVGVGRVGWADGLELGWGDVYNLGGSVVEPSSVVAGSMGRLGGVWDDRAPNPITDTDIVADETEFDEDTNTVQVKPVGLQPRTIAEVATWLE